MCEIDESEIELKFDDLCRLCASYDNVKISLFSDEGKRRQLKKKIQCCLPFKVEENDALPKSLCYKCVYNLESTYEFRYKCIQVNRNLEKHVTKKETEKQEKPGSSQSHRIHPEVSIFAIPSDQADNNQNANEASSLLIDSDDAPNPLDFLEVGVNAEDSTPNSRVKPNNDNKKQYLWNANKRWLSVEHKPLHTEEKPADFKLNMKYFDVSQDDNSLNRRKNNNPRKIARDADDFEGSTTPSYRPTLTPSAFGSLPTPGLIAINVAPPSGFKTSTPAGGDDGGQPSDTLDGPIATTSVIESNSHESEQTFSCLLCERSFTQRSALNKHFSAIHGIEPYEMLSQTPLLGHSAFSEDIEEELAESLVEQETIIFCEVCRREFQDRASLWLHMVHAHREEASVSCGICLKICSDNITLIEHVNTAHSGDKAVVQRRYSCQVCGRQHDSRQKLLKHATLHTLIDNQGQTIQPEEMVSLNNAFAPRECPICHKKFFNQEKLDQHTHNFHNESHEPVVATPSVVFRCELCASTHATRIDRWWHMYHSHNGDQRVTCEATGCRKIFVTQTLKNEHCNAHHEAQGQFTNTCEICGKLWESRTVFYKHMMNVHPKCLPTICGVCMKIFSNVPELRQHVQLEHPALEESGGICCDVCGRPYAERSKMLRHRRVHNVTDGVPFTVSMVKKKDDLQCNICPDVTFDNFDGIAEHRRTVHSLFVCDLCPKFYNGNNHLWKHVSKQHKGDPSVTCNICLRTSASRAHLDRHKIKYHSDPVERLVQRQPADPNAVPQTHKCALCGREFRIRSLLKKHSKSCKGVKPPVMKVQPVNGVFPCGKCGKVFEQQSVLSKHMRNSHVMHFCEACPEDETKVGFDKKSALLEHIRAQHPNDPELVCDVEGCGKVLRVKADLQKHKLEHVRGYFTYICECCGDMFSNRKKLRKHLLTFHKSDVKHLCAVCVAIMTSVTELADHVQTQHPLLLHRPYTCQICGKCWSVGSKAVDHISKVHGTEYKPCKICWKVFTDEKEFEEHVQNHPPVEEKPVTPAKPKEPTATRVRPSKSSMQQELIGLGIDYESEVLGKRTAEEEPNYEESGKRLRKKYKCTSCKETFRSIDELKEHKLEHHGSQVCNPEDYVEEEQIGEDSQAGRSAAEVDTDAGPKTERWTDVKPIACDCCRKVWNSKKQLWQHMIRSHVHESMHTCGICLRVCDNYYDLAYHLDEQHSSSMNDNAARFACYVCGHYHNSQSKLDKHFVVHKSPPPQCEYTCQYCQRVYRSVVYYREHLRTHEVAAATGVPKKESTAFSGFSMDSRLEARGGSGGQEDDEHEDDIELEMQKMVEDEDLVELDEDDDSELDDNSNSGELDDNVFRGYEAGYAPAPTSSQKLGQLNNVVAKEESKFAFASMPAYFKAKEESMDIDLESNISCSSVNSANELQEEEDEEEEDDDDDVEEGVLNGKQESSDEQRAYSSVNNNQKQDRKAPTFDEKRNFHNSNGENYFRRVTEDI